MASFYLVLYPMFDDIFIYNIKSMIQTHMNKHKGYTHSKNQRVHQFVLRYGAKDQAAINWIN